MAFPLIPVLFAAASAVGQWISSRSSRKQAQETNKANLELAKYGNQADRMAVAEQNAYNTPSAQLQRFQDAGLNPALIYGSGSAGGGNQASAPKFDTPRADMHFQPFQLPEVLSQYQNWQMNVAQTDNVKAQTENIRARTQTEAMRNILTDIQGKSQAFDLDTKDMLRPYNLQAKELDVRQKGLNLNQSIQRLKLMSQQELINNLEQHAKERNLRTIDLAQEKMAAETLYLKYRNEWAKEGITGSDNPIIRVLTRMMIQGGIAPSQQLNKILKR